MTSIPSMSAAPLMHSNALSLMLSISFLALSGAALYVWKQFQKTIPSAWVVAVFSLFMFLCAVAQTIGIIALSNPQPWIFQVQKAFETALVLGAIVLLPFLLKSALTLCEYAKASRRHEACFLATADASMDAIFLLNAVRNPTGDIEDFRFTYLNQQAYRLFDIPQQTLLGAKLCELLPSYRDEGFFELFKKVVHTGRPRDTEFSISDPQINAVWLRYSIVKLEDGIAIAASDLTRQKETESKIRNMAQHDPLTGLPNRILLDDRIQQAIERAIRYRQNAAVLMLDLDNFKAINDTYGHAAGDEVLKTVATRLCASVRATDSVFRLGGDEFVIVLGDLATKGPIVDFSRKIFVNLLPPIPWEQEILHTSASIGIANYPGDGSTPEALLVQADIAMYRMKRGRTKMADTTATVI